VPRGRTKGDHDAKRVEIAEAACKVFLRLGLERTSLADIGREIGSSTGVLRHYFADKADLLLYTKNYLFDRSHRRAQEAAEPCSGLDKLRALLVELLPTHPDIIDAYRLLTMFNGSAIGDPHLVKLQAKRDVSHILLIAEIIEGLQEAGIVGAKVRPRFEAAALLALIDGVSDQIIMRPSSWTRADLELLVDRQLELLAASRSR